MVCILISRLADRGKNETMDNWFSVKKENEVVVKYELCMTIYVYWTS